MEIQVGDRFTDQDFEWEVLTRPAALHGGKSMRARVRRPGLLPGMAGTATDSGPAPVGAPAPGLSPEDREERKCPDVLRRVVAS